jgi:hypothetical protein
MQVSFKLTTQQVAAAKAQLDDPGEMPDYSWFNSNQQLVLDGNILKYAGERCPMVQDGVVTRIGCILIGVELPPRWYDFSIADDVAEAAFEAVKSAKPIKYKTSDVRLLWYETLDIYMSRREVNPAVVIKYLKQKYGASWGCYAPHYARSYSALLPAVKLVGMRESLRCAQYPYSLVRVARLLEANQI